MTTNKKLVIIIATTLILALSLGFLFSCSSQALTEEDFLLELSVDKTTVYVGDIITVTATLTNVSGRNIRLALPNVWHRDIENLLHLSASEGGSWGLPWTNEGGFRRRRTFRNNAVITRTHKIQIDELTDYDYYTAKAAVFFRTRGWFSFNREFFMQSERILITVQGEI